MREIIIKDNDREQRVDRFLKKYFEQAPLSFIYKNLRKKNIKVNGKKASPEEVLQTGDVITLYFSDEVMEKFRRRERKKLSGRYPEVLYEDDQVILMKKKAGILTHNDRREYVDNMVDRMVDYLIAKEEYVPRLEQSFRPGICNRLDRNTSGILIGAKTAQSLKELNRAMRKHEISKYYLTVVKGKVPQDFSTEVRLEKDGNNQVHVSKKGKESETHFHILLQNEQYTLLSCQLITGRTHQIRASLQHAGYPVIGDQKYGDGHTNGILRKRYGYVSQFLHNYKVTFETEGQLRSLSQRSFYYPPEEKEREILCQLFPTYEDEVLK